MMIWPRALTSYDSKPVLRHNDPDVRNIRRHEILFPELPLSASMTALDWVLSKVSS